MKLGRNAKLAVLLLIAASAGLGALGISGLGTRQNPCTRPVGGFLIVASNRGYNDSVDRLNFSNSGPLQPWPVISVSKGSTVRITVCNTDTNPHGFQIEHYSVDNVISIAPGKAISLSFTANQTGTFRIYCQIPCPIHLFMQYGRLVVS